MRHTLSCNINDTDQHELLEAIKAECVRRNISVSSLLVEALTAHLLGGHQQAQEQPGIIIDNAVMDALDRVEQKLDDLARRRFAPENRQGSDIPLRTDDLLDAADEANLELEQDFILSLKSVARPGMRLDD